MICQRLGRNPDEITLVAVTKFATVPMIKEALKTSGGNKQKASEALGITRQGLIKKIKRYGLS